MMKKSTILKTLLLGTMLLGGASLAEAACSVTPDATGKVKVVWDFGVEAQSGGATYYLNANDGTAYETSSSTYGTARRYYTIAKVVVESTRSIKSNESPDADKGSGVIIGSNNGYIELYAPVSGTMTITGKYLTNIVAYAGSSKTSTSGTDNSRTINVTSGTKYLFTGNTKAFCIATITITPADYDTDVMASGDWTFNNTEVFLAPTSLSGTNQITSKGYKTIENTTTKDVFIVKANSGSITIDPNGENRGLKFASGAEFDYTPTNAGYLTIVYDYGADRGSWYIKNGDSNATFIGKKGSSSTGASSIIYLPAGYRAQWVCGSGSNTSVLIRSITFTEGSPVSATMGIYGYTTFASSWPLDLSNLPSGLNAYYVTSSGISASKVTLTEVTTTVAAGTGLILKGTASTGYSIPVTSSGTDLSSTNKLVGCTSNTNITSSTSNYANFYVLVNTASQAELQNLSSYLSSGENTVTIPAGKAYLDATGVINTARFSIAFEDETTGLNDVKGEMLDGRSDYYNLAGQRVVKPAKGLYVKNGKKYIIK